MVEVTLIEASRRAALQEMRRDERVWVLGEDVARGGLWGQYKDFLAEFGPERVVSTPISESTIMGAGLGSADFGLPHEGAALAFQGRGRDGGGPYDPTA